MDYQLIAVNESGRRPLGSFGSYRDAVQACDEDIVAQLRAGGGWRRRIEHLIVGPGRDGTTVEHAHCTEIGVPQDRARPPGAADLAAAARWLAQIRRVCFTDAAGASVEHRGAHSAQDTTDTG